MKLRVLLSISEDTLQYFHYQLLQMIFSIALDFSVGTAIKSYAYLYRK